MLMGAKDYDFADETPEYRGSNRLNYKSTGKDKTRKRRKSPKSRAKTNGVGGIHNRRNKHVNW